MRTLIFSVEVRDKNCKRYKDSENNTVTDFIFSETWYSFSEESVATNCIRYFERFKAISPESKINVEVRELSPSTNTYPALYSFYGAENRFVKHN